MVLGEKGSRGRGGGGADKAFDIRLIAEAGDRACARRREGGCTYIYIYIYIYIERERERERERTVIPL